MKKTNLVILGSTGSIGTQALDVVEQYKNNFNLVGISCCSNIKKIKEQIKKCKPKYVAINDESKKGEINKFLKKYSDTKAFFGSDSYKELLRAVKIDKVLIAVSGIDGIDATLEAIDLNIDIALANKESLVMAGEYIMQKAKEKNIKIIPVDSEHSTIFSCLGFDFDTDYKKIYLTASGGAFRDLTYKELERVTFQDALKHPTWNMGPKITVDSATMMNKGFEAIEAMHLFSSDIDQIEVLIHKESFVHSMVEFKDNSIKAEIMNPDMKLPIARGLLYPEKISKPPIKEFSFNDALELTFSKPDLKKYRCLELAYQAIKKGGAYPCVLACANDFAVELFAKNKISFLDIPRCVEEILNQDIRIDKFKPIHLNSIKSSIKQKINVKYGKFR